MYGEYYEYHVGKNKEQGLEIRGCELSLLSDLVDFYLFETSKNHLPKQSTTASIDIMVQWFLKSIRKFNTLNIGRKI